MTDRHRLLNRINRGRANEHRYLLICIDVMDALKQDKDGGYYPVFAVSSEQVCEQLSKRQDENWSFSVLTDACEGIIDLRVNDAPEDTLKPPSAWLRDNMR